MKTVAVLFGGRSTEHDVSIITALMSVIKPLRAAGGYEVVPVYIAKDGNWYSDSRLSDIDIYRSGEIEQFIHKTSPVQILFDRGLSIVKSSQFAGRKAYKKIDVVFPALHGTYGEDGSVMGLLRLAHVPFVGCDMSASVVAMDKVLAKQVSSANNIETSKYCWFNNSEVTQDIHTVVKEVEQKLSYPLFIKPAHLGSSIGINRATSRSELMNALEVACHYDDKIIVEEEVTNLIEVTLPIIGNETLRPALLERPLTKPDEFFDFDTKYMNGGKKGKNQGAKAGAQGYSELPAKLEPELYDRAVKVGLDVYKALDCKGIARVDMLIDSKTQKVYFNEVNPMPGSLYAHNWRAAGMSSVELVDELIRLAEERFAQSRHVATSFTTNYLKQF